MRGVIEQFQKTRLWIKSIPHQALSPSLSYIPLVSWLHPQLRCSQDCQLSVFPGLLQALGSGDPCWIPASPLHGSTWEQSKQRCWLEPKGERSSWQHGLLPPGCGLKDLKGRGAQELPEGFFSVEAVLTAKLPFHLFFLPLRWSFCLTHLMKQRCDAASVHVGKVIPEQCLHSVKAFSASHTTARCCQQKSKAQPRISYYGESWL